MGMENNKDDINVWFNQHLDDLLGRLSTICTSYENYKSISTIEYINEIGLDNLSREVSVSVSEVFSGYYQIFCTKTETPIIKMLDGTNGSVITKDEDEKYVYYIRSIDRLRNLETNVKSVKQVDIEELAKGNLVVLCYREGNWVPLLNNYQFSLFGNPSYTEEQFWMVWNTLSFNIPFDDTDKCFFFCLGIREVDLEDSLVYLGSNNYFSSEHPDTSTSSREFYSIKYNWCIPQRETIVYCLTISYL
eukprot:TRINITY_DN1863_c0_g1_i1.p1 TRINITY_DN1863_c0_g1~~TRINITY_DN1863_c0_g1_i1.p1  ORF type:complete len:247 (+),score=46.21 TRINITY_DN1863_c0_g1_i1:621-1361(+)